MHTAHTDCALWMLADCALSHTLTTTEGLRDWEESAWVNDSRERDRTRAVAHSALSHIAHTDCALSMRADCVLTLTATEFVRDCLESESAHDSRERDRERARVTDCVRVRVCACLCTRRLRADCAATG